MLPRLVLRSNLPLMRRLIFTGHPLFGDALQQKKSVSKEALMNLRKKTGYSFANCRKALLQFGENDLTKAEEWLKEAARKEGWAKVEKLGSRQASQGLVAVLADNNVGALLELNCETDFVARSNDFKSLIEEIVSAILDHGKSFSELKAPSSHDEFVVLTAGKNRSMKEAIALAVGQMKENILIKKAQVIISHPKVLVRAHAHPHLGTRSVEMGQFASVIGISRNSTATKFPTDKLSHQVCQHVIGMRPEVLGTPESSKKPTRDLIVEKEKEERDELNDFADIQSTQLDENENRLLCQTFLLNPSMTVHEYLESHSAKLSWFLRLELGDNSSKV